MTIKTQGGKVITKGGKVSCSCCAEPGECCMYPAAALVDGLYTYEDLPDTVLGTGIFGDNNIVMSRLNPPQPSIDSSGTSYYRGTSTDGGLCGIGLKDGDEWVGTEIRNEDAEFGQCLISRFPLSSETGIIGDQFADTYTVAYVIGDDNTGSTTITRQSLCVWTGNAGGVPIRLEYDGTDFFRWFMITPETEIAKAEPSFENTPTGFYETGNIQFTVS